VATIKVKNESVSQVTCNME